MEEHFYHDHRPTGQFPTARESLSLSLSCQERLSAFLLLVLQLNFTGGQSNGNDLQNQIDNIQVNGTAVPEPATVAGGLLGVLGLCWHQRRRLIRSVRLRRT